MLCGMDSSEFSLEDFSFVATPTLWIPFLLLFNTGDNLKLSLFFFGFCIASLVFMSVVNRRPNAHT